MAGLGREKYLLAAHLRIEDDVLLCGRRGLVFEGVSLYFGDCMLSDNMILGRVDTAVVATRGRGAITGSFDTVSGNGRFLPCVSGTHSCVLPEQRSASELAELLLAIGR
jgi:hypothetical protein